jgi:type I restriction-modification system DNA methylase subunit
MALNFDQMRDCLRRFDFQRLFVDELGWSRPSNQQTVAFKIKEGQFARRQVAQLTGVVVFEVTSEDRSIPDAKTRAAVYKEVAKHHLENVLIFLDRDRTQSVWYWVKRQDEKILPRDHLYVQGQPGDLFVNKLGQMVFDISEFDQEGNVSLLDVARRVRAALDVERVTKRFYSDFQNQHMAFLELIQGVPDERERRWYASVLLNRLMFIYFLQKKGFLDRGDLNYLQNKLAWSRQQASDRFFSGFLKLLFFEGFAKPADRRSPEANQVLGSIKYLNGGLFLPHKVERDNPRLEVPDKAFENLFTLFDGYSWNLDDTPGGKDDEINPHVLGYIFEKYINQKEFGAYYTRPEITEYLCERTIHQLILQAVNTPESVMTHLFPGVKVRQFETVADLLMNLDAPLCKQLLDNVLPSLSLLDPACGSGAFLVAAMKTLINVYAAVIGKIKFLSDRNLSEWLTKTEHQHPSINYFIKKSIITDNLYGVDLMEEAAEIARLRLFLALVAAAQHMDQLEPLPNIDFNILSGNSLIGLMRVDDEEFDGRNSQENLFRQNYRQVLEEKNRLIDTYRHAATYAEDLTALRDAIDTKKQQAIATLDDILLDEFKHLGIKFEQATWDDKKNDLGKVSKRPLKPKNIERLRPFHWGFEFDEILNKRGGFDAIITNPPWEILKPNGKEFFEGYSDLISKKKMTIHDFEKQRTKLLSDPEIRTAWLDYLSQYPHQSAYFRSAPQYRHQVSMINGRKAASDINLYKLFVEQCYNLLRPGGRCGIITSSGIYTDLGTKQLREMLFTEAEVTNLYGLSNEKYIFEGVHHAQKFCFLVFRKDSHTHAFEAAFRVNPREAVTPDQLEQFLHESDEHLQMKTELVRRLSPDSLSVMEFKSDFDVQIAEKMLRFPLLGEEIEGTWNVKFAAEFHMTNDSRLFNTDPGPGRLPLYEGKMIWQFDHRFGEPRYWVDESEGRKSLLGRVARSTRQLDYQCYRSGIRAVSANTNERTLISTVIPAMNFCGNSVLVSKGVILPNVELLFLTAVLNSFTVDWILRNKITTNVNMFYLYQLPVPRLSEKDNVFSSIMERAAQLICTAPEFDDLAKEVGLKSHREGVADAVGRAELRAELDGLIAHLYGLTEEEFAHLLSTFPLVPDPVKVAAQNAYRDVERGLIT